MKYRRKPTEVEATQWFKHGDHPDVVIYTTSTPGNYCGHCNRLAEDHGAIPTSDGPLVVCPGDWVVKEPSGELHSCTDRVFKEDYEKI